MAFYKHISTEILKKYKYIQELIFKQKPVFYTVFEICLLKKI